MNEVNQRERELFIRYGSAASEAMFDFPCHFFEIPNLTGIIAYRIENKCAVVIGDPICPANELLELTQAFHKYCSESKMSIIYITVSKEFTKLIHDSTKISFEVCKETIIDPQLDPTRTSNRLQHRIDKAVNHGLTFHEYIPFDKEIEAALTEVGRKWQKGIKGRHLYLGHLNFFESHLGKRWFYVKDGENITAMLMLSKLEASEGWLLKFFASLPTAIDGTSEFMMTSLLDKLREENCHFLTKGMLPVDSLDEIKGLGNYSAWLVKSIYNIISMIFKFKKRKEYWQRYNPKNLPSYLVTTSSLGINEIRALIKVFRMR